MTINKNIYLCNLFDCYSELLTDKQSQYFQDYYFENLTLSEMSQAYKVTRNAVHNLLKTTEKKLIFYEDKLKLYYKNINIKKIIDELEEDVKNKINEFL